MTTATCADVEGPFEVILGAHELMDPENQKILAQKSYIHPDFDVYSLQNNIAILLLDEEIEFSNKIQPVNLATQETYQGEKALVTGWENGYKGLGFIDDLEIISKEECMSFYGDENCIQAPPGKCASVIHFYPILVYFRHFRSISDISMLTDALRVILP